MQRLQKYLRRPKRGTRQPFVGYIKKWFILSTVLGLLTGIIVALFDFVANLTLWSNPSPSLIVSSRVPATMEIIN